MLKYLLPLALVGGAVFADDHCPEPVECTQPLCNPDPCCVNILAELRAAYFLPTGSRFDDIYGGSGIYNLELSVQTWCDLYTWLSVGYLRESGQSKCLHSHTTFQMVPLSLGLKYLFDCNCFSPYVGAGIGTTWMDVHNHSDFVKKNVSKWGIGGVFKAGALWHVDDCWFLDFFIDYTYMKIGFSGTSTDPFVVRNDADISGFSFGAGIGYSF